MHQVVHLELHTHDLETASRFYEALLRWPTEQVESHGGRYHSLPLGGSGVRDGADGFDGGIVECGARPAGWLPYVSVQGIWAMTDRAGRLGASVLLAPREGPAGWRSVVSTPAGGEIALWERKR